MRALLIGAGGFLGPALVAAFEAAGAVVIAGGRSLVDVTDPAAVARVVADVGPDVVVNAAAVNPGAGGDIEAVNVLGARHVARAAAGRRLVHVSTDVVHDGTAAPYADDTAPSPIGSYGVSKAAGEALVAADHPAAVIVRPSLIWDPDRIDRPTAGFADRLAAGQPLRLYDDAIRQPVLATDLASLILVLATSHREVQGTVNAGGMQALTRMAFGTMLLTHFQVPGGERAEGVSAPDGVPRDLRLRTDVADGLGVSLRGVQEVLARR